MLLLLATFLVSTLSTCPTTDGGSFGSCTESCSVSSPRAGRSSGLPSCPIGYECCSNGCGHECVCTAGVAECSEDFCTGKTCGGHPDAECVVEKCGGCKAVWKVNGEAVKCTAPPKMRDNSTAIPIIATWYCSLDGSKGRCFPGSCGTEGPPSNGFGIAALNPEAYTNAPTCHYRGSACGQCWSVRGPNGTTRIQVTDCCAGYPNSCTCLNCPKNPQCDWCAHNDNLHFDLDYSSFMTVCGNAGVQAGHCVLSGASRTNC